MAKDPTFPFYAQDYLVDTLRWSRAMKSLHVDLLAETWVNGPLIDEGGHPAGLEGEDIAIWERIKHKWEKRVGFWVNAKLEEVRGKREKFREKQTLSGKKGGRPKKATEAELKGFGFENENPKETQPFLKTKPNENPKETLLESENEKEYELDEEGGTGEETKPPPVFLVPAMLVEWKKHKPGYPEDREKDFPALQSIAEFICNQAHTAYDPRDGDVFEVVMSRWAVLAAFIPTHKLFRNYSLAQVDRHSQSILQSLNDNENGTENQPPSGGAGPAPGRTGTYAERMSTARAALAGRLHTKVDSLRPAGEGGVSG